MFSDLDFSLLDSPAFEEDSVREKIVAPILRRLGYRSSGFFRMQTSKLLGHPYVMFGSKTQRVNIVPDYTLYAGDDAIAIVVVKGPTEPILHSRHAEQAYSYAIHPEIRVSHYALCNGSALIMYRTDQWEPLLHVSVQDIEDQWSVVEEALHPKFLSNLPLGNFAPDFGMAMLKAGIKRDAIHIFLSHHLQMLARVTDDLYTVSTTTKMGEVEYMASFDLTSALCQELLSRLPRDESESIQTALNRVPFRADLEGKVLLTCAGSLGEVTSVADEELVPILISGIGDVVFDPSVTLI